MNNLHSVFTSKQEGFKYKILPSQTDCKTLNDARKSVRSFLKTHIKEYLESQQIHFSPKFRVQGSWAYGTCNAPAKLGQEMDVDYGVYLPVSAFDGFDVNTQSEQAKAYFEAVESMLEELCKTNGWQLDTSKVSCIRLKIQANAHMDIPLYAVPDSMFHSFQEKNEMKLSAESAKFDSIDKNRDWLALDESFIDFSEEESLRDMDIQTIHMAKRNGEWQSSDCEIIRQWFSDRLSKEPNHGQQLRSICRYLKAWRDWAFDEGGAPSSILLMIIACKHYEYQKERDDLALLNVLEKLPQSLNSDVYENIKEHENENFNRMNATERHQAKIFADDLYKYFVKSLNSTDKKAIFDSLTKQWGERIPLNDDLVQIDIDNDPFAGPSLAQTTITSQIPLRQG